MKRYSQEKNRRAVLRREILARRDSLPELQRQEKSSALAARLGTLDCFNQARSILFFVSFRSEVDTLPLMRQALDRGVQVSAPLTIARDKELKIYALTELETDLVSGYQGIWEPNPECCLQLDTGSLDLVIVPGSVFDLQGGRMGYGGGYYDRLLANRVPQATRVGICFDLQLVEKVPMAAHDQYLDYVVTESQIAESGHLR
jgi:5-formyltetrahydrofolate cyclo-ligase